jgi:aminopeptidase N
VVGEPQGSPGWYPVNDNPQDKATYTFRVTVPRGLTVMANGVLVSQTSTGGTTTFVWREGLPMAPCLATWIWSEHQGRRSAHRIFRALYHTPAQDTDFWTPPPRGRDRRPACSTARSTTGAP